VTDEIGRRACARVCPYRALVTLFQSRRLRLATANQSLRKAETEPCGRAMKDQQQRFGRIEASEGVSRSAGSRPIGSSMLPEMNGSTRWAPIRLNEAHTLAGSHMQKAAKNHLSKTLSPRSARGKHLNFDQQRIVFARRGADTVFIFKKGGSRVSRRLRTGQGSRGRYRHTDNREGSFQWPSHARLKTWPEECRITSITKGSRTAGRR